MVSYLASAVRALSLYQMSLAQPTHVIGFSRVKLFSEKTQFYVQTEPARMSQAVDHIDLDDPCYKPEFSRASVIRRRLAAVTLAVAVVPPSSIQL